MLEFPNIKPDSVSWGLAANLMSFESDLSGTVQRVALPGARYYGTLTFSNRMGREAKLLEAFIQRINATAGIFLMAPPALNNLGSMGGAGRVAGANQTGLTLNTNQWQANQQLLFAAGDYIEVGGRVYMVVEDAASNGSGQATLQLNRPLLNSPANNSTVIKTPKVKMMMPDVEGLMRISSPFLYAGTIEVVEDLL